MSCKCLKNTHYKSTTQFYNNATQNILATNTITNPVVANLGVQTCDTGCSFDTSTNSISVKSSGTYMFNINAVLDATTGGDVTLALTSNGSVIPDTLKTIDIGTGASEEVSTSYVGYINANCLNNDVIRIAMYSDGTFVGNVASLSGNGVKLA